MRSPNRTSVSTGSNVTVALHATKVAWLDRLAVDIRLRHGVALTRGEIIRAIVEATSLAGVDLSAADSGRGMAAILIRSWPRPRT